MFLVYDRSIIVSVGDSRRAVTWTRTDTTVSGLYDKLQTPVIGEQTLEEFLALKKSEQDDIKDVGGFVGGALSGGRRKASAVLGRDLIALDFDSISCTVDEFFAKCETLQVGYCVYSTRKHTPTAPRLRLIVPLARTCSVDEYEPVARYVASRVGIDMADPATYEASRLMYWPSVCKDVEYVFKYSDNVMLDPDAVLASQYTDWRDPLQWPTAKNESVSRSHSASRQGDPRAKDSLVGAFCRRYDIIAAMDAFLPGIYIPCESPNRFTFVGGSTVGGAIVYSDYAPNDFLYSHHATDPCSGKLVNAFDMVRLHKFASLDDGASETIAASKLPSYRAMCTFVESETECAADLLKRRAEQDFADLSGPVEITGYTEDCDDDGSSGDSEDSGASSQPELSEQWAVGIRTDNDGRAIPTIDNIVRILRQAPDVRGRICLNRFSGRIEVIGPVPWDNFTGRRLWGDTDLNGIYWYLESRFRVVKRPPIDSAVDLCASAQSFDEVEDYLNSVEWDGTPRVDTLLIDYLGATDTTYTRAVTRKTLVAAVARALNPGCKFDYMLVILGPQGIGKSKIIKKLANGWDLDSITTFEGKDAAEQMRGKWLVEIAELDAIRKSDMSRVKQFLTIQRDVYRAAYGRNAAEYPRRSIFIGTGNYSNFLSDVTGNRRFWPVEVGVKMTRQQTSSRIEEITPEVRDQIWAEARMRYAVGEPLFLSGRVEEEAEAMQLGHMEENIIAGQVRDFISKEIPTGFERWSMEARRAYWKNLANGVKVEGKTQKRKKICAAEIMFELLGVELKDMRRGDNRIREINVILEETAGYERMREPRRFGPYGLQRGFTAGIKGSESSKD